MAPCWRVGGRSCAIQLPWQPSQAEAFMWTRSGQVGGTPASLMASLLLGAATNRSLPATHTGRKNPGLSAQHLTGLQLVASITRGSLEGGAICSTSIE